MARRSNSPRQIIRSVEIALVAHLNKQGSFKTKDCAVVEHSTSDEAPDDLPCIIVKCVNVTRKEGTHLQMYSKTANVICKLVTDSEQNSLPQYEAIASDMECIMENLDTMQIQFNKPASGKDCRAIRGLHLHYIDDDFQTDSDVSGTKWEFGVAFSLTLDQVAS